MIGSLREYEQTSIGTKIAHIVKEGDDTRSYPEDIKDCDIVINHIDDTVTIKMMTAPASEGGKGAQLTDFFELAGESLIYLNGKYPCKENSFTLRSLMDASFWQKERTKDRDTRGVEGKNEE